MSFSANLPTVSCQLSWSVLSFILWFLFSFSVSFWICDGWNWTQCQVNYFLHFPDYFLAVFPRTGVLQQNHTVKLSSSYLLYIHIYICILLPSHLRFMLYLCKSMTKNTYLSAAAMILWSYCRFWEITKINNSIATLDFRRIGFSLVRDLLHMNSWDTGLEGKGDHESWLVFQSKLWEKHKVSPLSCLKDQAGVAQNHSGWIRNSWLSLNSIRSKSTVGLGWVIQQ